MANCNGSPRTFAGPDRPGRTNQRHDQGTVATIVAVLYPAERILFAAAGPDVQVGEFRAEQFGEFLDGKALTGIMSRQQKRDTRRFRFQTSVKTRFPSDQETAAALARSTKKFAGTTTGNGDLAYRLFSIANLMQARNCQLLFQSLGNSG